jgi:predicted P-loop ATPase
VSDGYGGALALNDDLPAPPKGVTYDRKTGQIHPTYRNTLILIGTEYWDLGYNELTQTYGLRGEVEYPWPAHLGFALNDAIRREIRLYMLRKWGVTFKLEDIYEATMTLARRNTFNPVVDYLAWAEPRWDGKPRVERWLETYMGVKVTNKNAAYVRAIGKIVLVAAARRARKPGCKFDEMLILEGPQGINKSNSVGVLGGEWYSDAKLGDLENTQRVGMKLCGTWIHEFGELVGLTKAQVEEVKAFLSTLRDRYKQPYGRSEDYYPRRCIFIGTVNPGGGAYLTDLTGNRRFWPVVCGDIDIEALARDRDQLWAEAAMMESRGDSIRLDPSLYDAAKAEQDARLADDPWVEMLAEYLDGQRAHGKTRVLSMTLLSDALEIPKDKLGQPAMKKLKAAMALIPTWEYKAAMRADGVRSAGYEYVGA